MNIQTVHSSDKKLTMHYYDEQVGNTGNIISKRYTLSHAQVPMPKRFMLEIFNFLQPKKGLWSFYEGSGGFLTPKDPPIQLGIIDRKLKMSFDVDFTKVTNDLYAKVTDTLNGSDCSLTHLALTNLAEKAEEVKTETVKTCNHQWVNYGFNSIKYCCKSCGMEKPNGI
jgi:hypothetical protein